MTKTQLNHRGHTREGRSVITLCACWFTRDFFPIVDRSQSHPTHISLLCLFTHVYFCPDLNFWVRVWPESKEKAGVDENTAAHQLPAFLPAKTSAQATYVHSCLCFPSVLFVEYIM